MRRLGGKGLAALDGAQVQFTHLLCFAKCPPGTPRVGCGAADGLTDLGSTVPDVVARGPKPGGLRKGACCMGATATAAVVKWAQRRLPGLETVIDPFCGAGTVLAVANAYGLRAIGRGSLRVADSTFQVWTSRRSASDRRSDTCFDWMLGARNKLRGTFGAIQDLREAERLDLADLEAQWLGIR